MIAGSIVLGVGRTAFYAFNGRLRSALPLRPNEVLQWDAIRDACRRGFERYDLGEVTGGDARARRVQAQVGRGRGPDAPLLPPAARAGRRRPATARTAR